jgi:hypothetical protein
VLNATRYDWNLKLEPSMFLADADTVPDTFQATVAIAFQVQQQPASCVVLNAKGLTIQAVSVQPGGGAGEEATAVCGGGAPAGGADGSVSDGFERRPLGGGPAVSTADLDLVAISLGNVTLQPGSTAVVTLQYSGLLGAWPQSDTGLFRSAPFLPPAGGLPGVLVVTQGAQLGARAILPCYDQPARKAVFGVTLEVR